MDGRRRGDQRETGDPGQLAGNILAPEEKHHIGNASPAQSAFSPQKCPSSARFVASRKIRLEVDFRLDGRSPAASSLIPYYLGSLSTSAMHVCNWGHGGQFANMMGWASSV